MPITTNTSTSKNTFALALACITWCSIALQYYLTTGSAINFFSFFTIQCNLLIAISLSFAALSPQSKAGKFFSSLSVQSAIAIYIFIVCLVYNFILRGLFVLTGWHWFVDNMLHVVIPVLYIFYWLYFRTNGKLNWKDGIYWTIYPLVYLVYSLIRGSIVQWYPYPFLHAGNLGYPTVMMNIMMVIVVFLVASLGVIYSTRAAKFPPA
jgi:hypothetical protein